MGGAAACRSLSALDGFFRFSASCARIGWQPERLHLRIQRISACSGLAPRIRLARIARHGIRQRGFVFDALTCGSELQTLCRGLFRFRGIAEGGFAQSGDSPARSLRFLCCPRGWRNRQTAWSVPAPCPDDPRRPRCRRPATAQSSLRAGPQTTLCCSAIAAESGLRNARA